MTHLRASLNLVLTKGWVPHQLLTHDSPDGKDCICSSRVAHQWLTTDSLSETIVFYRRVLLISDSLMTRRAIPNVSVARLLLVNGSLTIHSTMTFVSVDHAANQWGTNDSPDDKERFCSSLKALMILPWFWFCAEKWDIMLLKKLYNWNRARRHHLKPILTPWEA